MYQCIPTLLIATVDQFYEHFEKYSTLYSLERKFFFFIMNIIVCGVFSQYWRKFTGQKMSSQFLSLLTLLICSPPFLLFVELKKHVLKQLLLYPFIIVNHMLAKCRSQIKIIYLM